MKYNKFSLIRLAVFMIISLVLGIGLKADSKKPIQSFFISMTSGEFTFELFPLGMDPSKFSISIISHPNKNGLVDIGDEIGALAQFLERIEKNGIKLADISYIYMPSTNAREVQERLIDSAEQSEAWLRRKGNGASKIVVSLLVQVRAFRELEECLRAKGIEIDGMSVENIAVKRSLLKPKIFVPYRMAVHFRLKSSSAR